MTADYYEAGKTKDGITIYRREGGVRAYILSCGTFSLIQLGGSPIGTETAKQCYVREFDYNGKI